MNKICICHNSVKTGQTSVMCCNVCGLPDEDFWQPSPSTEVKGQQERDIQRLYGELNILVRLRSKLAKEEILDNGKWITVEEMRNKVWEQIEELKKLNSDMQTNGASQQQSNSSNDVDKQK